MNDKNSTSPATRDTPLARASFIFLILDPTRGIVEAELEPSSDAQPASLEGLKAELAQEGFGDFYTTDDVLRPVILAANSARSGRFSVAERRDAAIKLTISPDNLSIRAQVARAYGGRALSVDWLQSELSALGVPGRCVLSEALAALADAGEGQNVLVAAAVLPEKGQDAKFEALVDARKHLAPAEDEHGRVNFYQSHEFIVVDAGAPLMRRIPPTMGKMGIDVQRTVLMPQPGADLPFHGDMDGAQIAPGDPSLLVAAMKGHPVVMNTAVKVDPTLRVKNVNLATGNISFDGSVEISGDVASGLTVQATGDIFIHGMVEKARITARRNLIIKGGVVGDDLGRDEDDQLILRTRLRAGGNINVKFVNLAEVIAGQNISVREYAMQSHLRANGSIFIGQEGGKGSLIGGRAQSGELIVANAVGSEAYVATEVLVGKENVKRRLLERLKQAFKLAQHNSVQLQKLLTEEVTPQKREKIQNTIGALDGRQQRIRRIVERLLARQRSSHARQIDIKRQLYANVTLTIDGVTHITDIDTGPRCLIRSGVELIPKP